MIAIYVDDLKKTNKTLYDIVIRMISEETIKWYSDNFGSTYLTTDSFLPFKNKFLGKNKFNTVFIDLELILKLSNIGNEIKVIQDSKNHRKDLYNRYYYGTYKAICMDETIADKEKVVEKHWDKLKEELDKQDMDLYKAITKIYPELKKWGSKDAFYSQVVF